MTVEKTGTRTNVERCTGCLAPSDSDRQKLERGDVKKLLEEYRNYIRSGQLTREIERNPERLHRRLEELERMHREMTDAIELLDYEQRRVIIDRIINLRTWTSVYMGMYMSRRTAQNRMNAGLDRLAVLLEGSETERAYLAQRRNQL